jgi:hypothetical protein
MPSRVCQFLYVKYHMLATYYEFTVISVYMPYVNYRMPVIIYLHLYADTLVPSMSRELPSYLICQSQLLYVKLLYLSLCAKCFISYAICQMLCVLYQVLYAKCHVLYAKLHMLDCNMPNAITIVVSFSITTE